MGRHTQFCGKNNSTRRDKRKKRMLLATLTRVGKPTGYQNRRSGGPNTMNSRTKCTAKKPCKECRQLRELGVILHKQFKHIISLEAPEPTQHDAHLWRARIVCPVKHVEIPPKFKRGKRV